MSAEVPPEAEPSSAGADGAPAAGGDAPGALAARPAEGAPATGEAPRVAGDSGSPEQVVEVKAELDVDAALDEVPTSEPPPALPRSRRAAALGLSGPIRGARATPKPARAAEDAGEGRPLATSSPPPSQRRRDSAPAAPRTISPMRAVYPISRAGADAHDDGDPRSAPGPYGGPPPPLPPRSPLSAHLSPRMTAIFGGLFGLACITSIVALLIQIVPPRDDRRAVSLSDSASPSASPSGSARADAPEPKKKKQRTAIPGPWRVAELEKDTTVAIHRGTMEKKSFVDALGEKGVPVAQSYRVMKALDELRKFDKTNKKDRFTVALDRASKRIKAFEFEVTPSEIYQARENDAGVLVGSKLDMKIAEEEAVGAFYMSAGDAAASAEAGGLDDGVISAIDDAFNGRLSHESFEEGSVVKVIAVEETALGLFSKYKHVVAVEYRPQDPSAPPVRAYSFKGQDAHGYFDDKGKQPYSGGWQSPLAAGMTVVSPFNPHRMHPVLHKLMPHEGTDLRAPTGTPIYSAYRGVIASAGPLGPCGNAVVIDHPNGVQTGYCHMSRLAPDAKAGEKVGVHHLIGYAGATGRATGPHLHFFAKRAGKFFDAMTLQLNGERVMPPGDRPAFAAAKAELDKRLDAIPLPDPPPEKPKAVAAAGSATPADKEAPEKPAKEETEADPKSSGGKTHTARQVASPAALASAAAAPGIHPKGFVEDTTDDDAD